MYIYLIPEVAEFKTVNEKKKCITQSGFVCENNPLVYNQSLYNKFIEDYRKCRGKQLQ